MKIYIIDTNALISFITDRNPSQQELVAKIFKETAKLRAMVLCPQNVLTEFVYVMDKIYKIDKITIQTIIKEFVSMPGIEVIHDINLNILLFYWPERIPDFGDAVVASVCKANKGTIIATFDKKFIISLKNSNLPTAF